MTADTSSLIDKIYEQTRQLPPESLADLAQYLEFLRFKARKTEDAEPSEERLHIVKLGGLLKGYEVDVSPERLAEVRREMWRKFEDTGS